MADTFLFTIQIKASLFLSFVGMYFFDYFMNISSKENSLKISPGCCAKSWSVSSFSAFHRVIKN